jgi:hypothetical protein
MPFSKSERQAHLRIAVWLEFACIFFIGFGYCAERIVFPLFYIGLPSFFNYQLNMVFQVFGIPFWILALFFLLGVNFLILRKNKEILTHFVANPWSHLFPGRRLVLANIATFFLLIALFFVLVIYT